MDSPATLRRRAALALLAATLVAVPFTALLLAVSTRSNWLARLDDVGTTTVHLAVVSHLTLWNALRTVSAATQPVFLHLVSLAVAVVLWRRGRGTAAVWLMTTVLSGWLLSAVLKELVQRARPDVATAPLANGYSFPSGHALNSMVFALCMVLLLDPVLRGWRRVLLRVLAPVFVVLVAFDRIALGVHYISDVLAGWVVALATVAASLAAFGISLAAPATELVDADDDDQSHEARHHDDQTHDDQTHDDQTHDDHTRDHRDGARAPSRGAAASAAPSRGVPARAGELALRLVPGWAGIWAVLVGLGLLFTTALDGVWPLTAEDGINCGLEAGRTELGNRVTFFMSALGNTSTVVGLCVLAVVVLWRLLGGWRESLFVALCTTGQALVFLCTTLAIDRERPDVAKLDESPPTSSFPSGHTSASLALYLSLAVVVHRHVRRVWLRRLLVVLLVSAPIMVGTARLYRGMHHPSDLVGAMVNAGLVLWLTDRSLAAVSPAENPGSAKDRTL